VGFAEPRRGDGGLRQARGGGAAASEQRVGQAEQVADAGIANQLGSAVDHVE
jgi:hypothetical protein